MLKTILIITIIHCTIVFSHAQWVNQNSSTMASLRDVEFINRYTGWACGHGGKIIKTTDGGRNWINQPNPAVNKILSSICPVDSNVIYCIGWFETILKTTNGGTNWNAIRNGPVGTPSSYDAGFFINENTGWFAGDALYIKRTTDGGLTFDSTYIKWNYFSDFYFKDANTGLVCADGSGIFKTTNGGINWVQKEVPTGFGIPNFYKISFVNNQIGWVVGVDSRVFKTIDFGETWDSVGFVTGADEPYCIRFSSENTGWVGGTYGEIFKSTNGGSDWKRDSAGNQAFISSFYAYSDSIWWGVGGGGKIIYTETCGTPIGINMISSIVPASYELEQNYPNPFNPVTNINYQIKTTGDVKLIVYNILGEEKSTLVNDRQQPGSYQVTFDAGDNNLSSGIYIYSLFINNRLIDTKKMSLIK